MPKAIPEGLTPHYIRRALADLDSGLKHPFGVPTDWELVDRGRRYPPKAVVGLGFKHLTGRILGPKEFSGGESQGKANFVLRKLGFHVVKKRSGNAARPARVSSDLAKAAKTVIEAGYFTPAALKDERDRRLREIVQRRGQPEFRRKLIAAYQGRCAVTGTDAEASLEAAHIVPYSGPQSNHISNGLLLRADIHTLFDLDLIGIDPQTMAVALGQALMGTSYRKLHGKSLAIRRDFAARLSVQALAERWERFSRG